MRRATRTPFGNFTQVAPCPSCDGSGQVIADPCTDCNGLGLQQVAKKLRINIPAGVDTGSTLRLTGRGAVGPRNGSAGDLYVHIVVETPVKLTARQRELLEEFRAIEGTEGGRNTPKSQGFFDKLMGVWSELTE